MSFKSFGKAGPWPIKATGPDGLDIRPALRRLHVHFRTQKDGDLRILLPDQLTIAFPANGDHPRIVESSSFTPVLTVCYPDKG